MTDNIISFGLGLLIGVAIGILLVAMLSANGGDKK